MTFFNMFRAPYLDEDDGVNLGGGGTSTDTTGQQTTTQITDTTVQDGQQQSQQEQMFKLKYNHEEREIPYSQAVELAQKGMNYDKAVERAKQEARDAWISEQGYAWNGKQIKTEAEYRQALQERELETKIRSQYSNVPDEIVNELIANRRFREESLAEKKAREESERKSQEEKDFMSLRDSMYEEFYQEFPDYTTEEKLKSIPKEIWAEADKWLKTGGKEGRRLVDALTRHNFKNLQTQQLNQNANEKNADSSTGSVKNNGKLPQGFISKEDFEANKRNQQWMNTNYDSLVSSMKHWK